MKLIEADKVKRVMKDYWKAQVDKALTLTFTDSNEANKRINSYLEHNHELLKAIDELPSAEPEAISKWKKEFREYVDSLDIARDDWKGIIEYIDELPSVQPEIIRCKDCKYYKYGICMKIGVNKSFYGFCDWAERGEQNG